MLVKYSLIPRPLPDFISQLHVEKIGSGLGTRLGKMYIQKTIETCECTKFCQLNFYH